MDRQQVIRVQPIEPLIRELRGQKVLLDQDLARLYGVPNKRLNEQVRRNRARFPEGSLFQMSMEEVVHWRSQLAIANPAARMGRRPYAFSADGALLAATILRSVRAVQVTVLVLKVLINSPQLAVSPKELAAQLAELERRLLGHDESFRQLVSALRQLMTLPPSKPTGRLGFRGGAEAGTQARQHRRAPG